MPTYKRSSYDLFIHKVLVPNVRTILLVLAVVALGCGSWLETNTSNDCAFQNTISVFEVSIYQNISDPYALTPSSVTFGLWKHCFYYAQNCTCTPISLNYQLDAEQSIYAATNNQTMPTIDANHSSYIRLIPLIMALILSTASFGYSFWANRSHSRPLRFWIIGAVAFLAAVLVALAFGYTYQSYRSSILSACQAINDQSVRCASMAPKLEVILLAVALGLLVLASTLFGCVRRPNFSDSTTHEIYIDEKSPSSSSSKRPSTLFETSHRKNGGGRLSHPSETLVANKHPAMYDMSSDEALESWRDATLLERQQQQEQHDYHYYRQQEKHQHDLWTMPLRPPPSTALHGGRSNEQIHNRQTSSNTRAYPATGTASSPSSSSTSVASTSPLPSTTDMYNSSNKEGSKRQQQFRRGSSPSPRQEKTQCYHDGDISSDSSGLLPPTLPFADHSQRRRKSSSQQQHRPTRPTSHASGNTFGADGLLMDDAHLSSTCTLEELQQHHRGRHYSDASFRANTPTSYHYDQQHHSGSHESICFTPTFHHRSSSGVSTTQQHYESPPLTATTATNTRRKNSNGSSTVLYQHSPHHRPSSFSSSHQQSHVPTLQIPPPSRHPLNHKVIKDERIGAYFQQHQSNRSPS